MRASILAAFTCLLLYGCSTYQDVEIYRLAPADENGSEKETPMIWHRDGGVSVSITTPTIGHFYSAGLLGAPVIPMQVAADESQPFQLTLSLSLSEPATKKGMSPIMANKMGMATKRG